MDAAKWPQGFHQEIGFMKPMEQMGSNIASTCTTNPRPNEMLEKKTKPKEQVNCPRCNSTNTKFCYYNNYSLTQPRYFCKSCRRYWTEGGSLRNVPVGGGSRKNKKSSISQSNSMISASTSSSLTIPDLNPPNFYSNENPRTLKGQDLNLTFSSMQQPQQQDGLGMSHHQYLDHQVTKTETLIPKPSSDSNSCFSSSFELLRSGILPSPSTNNLNSFIPVSDSSGLYSSGFSFQDYNKPNGLCFSIDGFGGGGGGRSTNEINNNVQENINNMNGGRVLFPSFGDIKQNPSTNEADHHQQENKGQGNPTPSGYWNGMLSGGSSW